MALTAEELEKCPDFTVVFDETDHTWVRLRGTWLGVGRWDASSSAALARYSPRIVAKAVRSKASRAPMPLVDVLRDE